MQRVGVGQGAVGKKKSDLTQIQFFRSLASSTTSPPVEQNINSPFRTFHLTSSYQRGPDAVKGSKTFVCTIFLFDLPDLWEGA